MSEINPSLLARLDEMRDQFADLDRQLADPDIVSDHEKLRSLSIRRAAMATTVELYTRWQGLLDQATEHQQLIDAGDDAELVELAREELPGLREQAQQVFEQLCNDLVTADDRAIGRVIVELRAGTGGAEAALWAGDLLAMYQQFASSKGWQVEAMSHSAGEQGGLREAIVAMSGDGVWQAMGYEAGVHCVKRVPATESQGRVHTSTATVAVLPEPESVDVQLDEQDVDVHVTTAQGPGGQNVNKVATAVHLIHRPTGIEVRMQESKSQQQNRQKAWQLLRARLYEKQLQQARDERDQQRSNMIGTGGRSERIRTYRYKDNIAVDHRLGQSFNLQTTLAGELDPIVEALAAQDRANRLASI